MVALFIGSVSVGRFGIGIATGAIAKTALGPRS